MILHGGLEAPRYVRQVATHQEFSVTRHKSPVTNHPINQSTNQPINQSTSQPITNHQSTDHQSTVMLSDPQPWKTLDSRIHYANHWLTVVVDDVVLPSGKPYKYTRLEPAGIGVGVIGFDAQGRILLEREYRHGVGEVVWQVPGGLADANEDLRAAGLRELREETGFQPATITDATVRYLGVVWDNPAFGVAASHIYAAWGLEAVSDTRRDPAEFVTLHWVEPAWLRAAVQSGEIKDRVVVSAVAFLLLNGWLT